MVTQFLTSLKRTLAIGSSWPEPRARLPGRELPFQRSGIKRLSFVAQNLASRPTEAIVIWKLAAGQETFAHQGHPVDWPPEGPGSGSWSYTYVSCPTVANLNLANRAYRSLV
jgi:hypothetical protein